MSTKYPAGVIKSAPVVPAGPYQNSSASGVWTMEQAGYWIKQGNWPTAGNFKPDGGLYSWGRNNFGALGLGDTTNRSSPNQVGALTTWSKIIGGYATTALKTDGTLWTWGYNADGELGLGTSGVGTYKSSPNQVGALTTWSKISSGSFHTLATTTTGTLYSWGANIYGMLGLGNTTSYSSPKQVGALTTWLNITCGVVHSAAIKTDGTIWTWGQNTNGQLGLGTSGAGTNKSSPTQVGALTTWLNISAGGYCTAAIKTDGTLWLWGKNNNGQLGLGNTTSYSSPVQVGALTTWSKITFLLASTLAIKTDGTLWSWGLNSQGTLGLGNTTNYSSPKQVGALTTWSKVANGIGENTAAIKTDGTLWSWGYNAYGQLGLGDITNRSSPVQVGALTTWLAIACGKENTLAILS
jgi:alpha-tubulin suppressor-like RCC1 family protein